MPIRPDLRVRRGKLSLMREIDAFNLVRRHVASHAGVFRGARFSIPPIKTPAWEATDMRLKHNA